ncbi:MAG: prepilin-type N-terminal cleavage/methylation domain-containing protein [Minisyncoccia bacterium]
MKDSKKNSGGFTIIEVVIYIALFSILMTGCLTVAYQLLDGSGKLNSKSVIENEGNFVLRKFAWVLTGIDPAIVPTTGGSGCLQTLTISKTDSTVSPVVIRLNTISGINYIEIQRNGGSFYPITTINVSPTCLKFSLISGTPTGVSAIATISGVDFSMTKYVRK